MLAAALNRLAADPMATIQLKPVKKHIINPKALTLDQLYGSYDAGSHEWADGALPIILFPYSFPFPFFLFLFFRLLFCFDFHLYIRGLMFHRDFEGMFTRLCSYTLDCI